MKNQRRTSTDIVRTYEVVAFCSRRREHMSFTLIAPALLNGALLTDRRVHEIFTPPFTKAIQVFHSRFCRSNTFGPRGALLIFALLAFLVSICIRASEHFLCRKICDKFVLLWLGEVSFLVFLLWKGSCFILFLFLSEQLKGTPHTVNKVQSHSLVAVSKSIDCKVAK